jgi:hypothetical protein
MMKDPVGDYTLSVANLINSIEENLKDKDPDDYMIVTDSEMLATLLGSLSIRGKMMQVVTTRYVKDKIYLAKKPEVPSWMKNEKY